MARHNAIYPFGDAVFLFVHYSLEVAKLEAYCEHPDSGMVERHYLKKARVILDTCSAEMVRVALLPNRVRRMGDR